MNSHTSNRDPFNSPSVKLESPFPNIENVAFIVIKDIPLPPQFAALHYDARSCPQILSIFWNIYQRGGEDLVFDLRLIRPDGFEVTPKLASSYGLTQESLIEGAGPLETVLRKLAADFEKHRPTSVMVNSNELGLHVLNTGFVRCGFFPQWLTQILPPKPL